MIVKDARDIITDSVLHTGNETWSETKIDRAIIVACRRFLRDTKCQQVLSQFPTVSGTREYTLNTALHSSLAGFVSGSITGKPFIDATDFRAVEIMSFEFIKAQYDSSNISGRPELMGFVGTTAWLYPNPDAVYTIRVPNYADLDVNGWTIGGSDSTTLTHEINIPERYVWDVMWWGARSALIYGAPGHPDSGPAHFEFQNVIERAKNEAQNAGAGYFRKRDYLDQTYGPNRGL